MYGLWLNDAGFSVENACVVRPCLEEVVPALR